MEDMKNKSPKVKKSPNEVWNDNYHSKWGKGINAKRREKYHTDHSYRAEVLSKNRANYDHTKQHYINYCDHAQLDALVIKEGRYRTVYINGKIRLEPVITYKVTELSKLLGRPLKTIKNYLDKGLLPDPIYEYATSNNGYARKNKSTRVYVIAEVMAIASILYRHFCNKDWYTDYDTTARHLIFTHVERVRKDFEKF